MKVPPPLVLTLVCQLIFLLWQADTALQSMLYDVSKWQLAPHRMRMECMPNDAIIMSFVPAVLWACSISTPVHMLLVICRYSSLAVCYIERHRVTQ